MHQLVLLRHGQSTWNRENRFTGWTDVPLTDTGRDEAREAGTLLREAGFSFDRAFTSTLKRAIHTRWIGLEELDQMWLPVTRSWRLNERHYGDLQGLNKKEMAEKETSKSKKDKEESDSESSSSSSDSESSDDEKEDDKSAA